MQQLLDIRAIPEYQQVLLYSTETTTYCVGVREGDSFLIGTLKYSPDLFSHYQVLVPV